MYFYDLFTVTDIIKVFKFRASWKRHVCIRKWKMDTEFKDLLEWIEWYRVNSVMDFYELCNEASRSTKAENILIAEQLWTVSKYLVPCN